MEHLFYYSVVNIVARFRREMKPNGVIFFFTLASESTSVLIYVLIKVHTAPRWLQTPASRIARETLKIIKKEDKWNDRLSSCGSGEAPISHTLFYLRGLR